MARFFALDFLNQKKTKLGALGSATLLGSALLLSTPAWSQSTTMMMESAATTTNAAPAAPKAPAPVAPKGPAPAAPGNPAKPAVPPQTPPPPVPDTFNRYGKIWAPSDDVAHPIKLNMQFPGMGEMKIPSQEELKQRDKLEDLAKLSDDEIRTKLAEWPPYAKMKLADEGQLLIRIQQFKEQRTKIAMDRARELGLINSLTPDQKIKFEKEYWDKKLQMDRDLAKQFEPVFKAKDQKLREDLFKEFSTAGTVVPPPAPKPPSVPLADNKPAASTNAPSATPPVGAAPAAKPPTMPIAQGKPAPGTAAPVAH